MSRLRVSPNSYSLDAWYASTPVEKCAVSCRPSVLRPNEPNRCLRRRNPRKSIDLSVSSKRAEPNASLSYPSVLSSVIGRSVRIQPSSIIRRISSLISSSSFLASSESRFSIHWSSICSGMRPISTSFSMMAWRSASNSRGSEISRKPYEKPLWMKKSEISSSSSSRLRPSSGEPIHFVYLAVAMLIERFLVAVSFHRVIPIEVLRPFAFACRKAALFGTADLIERVKSFENKFRNRRTKRLRRVCRSKTIGTLEQTRHTLQPGEDRTRRFHVGELDVTARFEPFDHVLEIRGWETLPEHHLDGLSNQIARYAFGALQFPFVFQLELSGDGWNSGVDIRNARHDGGIARDDSAALGVAHCIFQTRNRQTLAHARPFVDTLISASLECDALHNLFDKRRDSGVGALPTIARQPRLLLGDGDAYVQTARIMRFNFRADSIF